MIVHNCYEEQIMMIGREIGKFDPSQLNRFRKFLKEGQKIIITNKRKYNKLRKEFYDQFIREGLAQELDNDELERLWQMMVKFSQYSFNKSHSISYSLLAYQTMYMSTTFPGHWYASVLNESPGKLSEVIEEIKKRTKEETLGIRFSPPQLGNFYNLYTFVPDQKGNPYDGTIYIGLRHIKGFGVKAMPQMESLIGRDFKKIEEVLDFIKENKLNAINKTALLAMANIGMFEEICPNRAKARATILINKDKNYRVQEENEGKKKWRILTIKEAMEKDQQENGIGKKFFFAAEKEAIGFAFIENPAANLKPKINKLQNEPRFKNKYIDGGLLSGLKPKRTKTGKQYYLLYVDSIKTRSTIMLFAWEKTVNRLGSEVFKNLKEYDTVVFVGHESDWKDNAWHLDELIIIDEES